MRVLPPPASVPASVKFGVKTVSVQVVLLARFVPAWQLPPTHFSVPLHLSPSSQSLSTVHRGPASAWPPAAPSGPAPPAPRPPLPRPPEPPALESPSVPLEPAADSLPKSRSSGALKQAFCRNNPTTNETA